VTCAVSAVNGIVCAVLEPPASAAESAVGGLWRKFLNFFGELKSELKLCFSFGHHIFCPGCAIGEFPALCDPSLAPAWFDMLTLFPDQTVWSHGYCLYTQMTVG
jgi:hypothetical protein